MKRIRRIPRGNRCDKTPDSRGVLLFRSKKGKNLYFPTAPLPILPHFPLSKIRLTRILTAVNRGSIVKKLHFTSILILFQGIDRLNKF